MLGFAQWSRREAPDPRQTPCPEHALVRTNETIKKINTMIKETNTMLEPYKAPTAKTIMVDLKSQLLTGSTENEINWFSMDDDELEC